jgi:hypothetical protein
MPYVRSAYIWAPDEDELPERLEFGGTLLVCDPEPRYTGVYDSDGTEIVRIPTPIGFRFGDRDVE